MRAQVAIEYVTIMMLALVLMIGYLTVASVVSSRAVQSNQELQAQKIALSLQQEIIAATQVRSGYSRTFYVDQQASGFPVNVNGSNGTVAVGIEDAKTTVRTPPFLGSPKIGYNTIQKIDEQVVFS